MKKRTTMMMTIFAVLFIGAGCTTKEKEITNTVVDSVVSSTAKGTIVATTTQKKRETLPQAERQKNQILAKPIIEEQLVTPESKVFFSDNGELFSIHVETGKVKKEYTFQFLEDIELIHPLGDDKWIARGIKSWEKDWKYDARSIVSNDIFLVTIEDGKIRNKKELWSGSEVFIGGWSGWSQDGIIKISQKEIVIADIESDQDDAAYEMRLWSVPLTDEGITKKTKKTKKISIPYGIWNNGMGMRYVDTINGDLFRFRNGSGGKFCHGSQILLFSFYGGKYSDKISPYGGQNHISCDVIMIDKYSGSSIIKVIPGSTKYYVREYQYHKGTLVEQIKSCSSLQSDSCNIVEKKEVAFSLGLTKDKKRKERPTLINFTPPENNTNQKKFEENNICPEKEECIPTTYDKKAKIFVYKKLNEKSTEGEDITYEHWLLNIKTNEQYQITSSTQASFFTHSQWNAFSWQ